MEINFISWLDECKNNSPSEDISVILVGNKKDLVDLREVTTEEAQEFASQHKIFFLETSALDNSDAMIEQVFQTLSEDIIKQKEAGEDDGEDQVQGGSQMKLRDGTDGAAPKKKGCC